LNYSCFDADSFVNWYRGAKAEAEHKKSQQHAAAAAAAERAPAKPDPLPWAERRNVLQNQLSSSKPNTVLATHCKAGAELYEFLDKRLVAPGPLAIAEALKFQIGTLEQAVSLLDLHRNGKVSIMEFVGGLSILGLDCAALCGQDMIAVFQHLDPEGSGSLQLQSLTKAPRRTRPRTGPGIGDPSSAASADCGEASALRRAQLKWAAVARWLATAVRRGAALGEERFQRGWRIGGTGNGVEGTPLLSPASAAAAEARRKGLERSSAELGMARFQATPAQVLLESVVAMREQEQDVRAFFGKSASGSLEGTHDRTMSRSDLQAFFEDLKLVEPRRHAKLNAEVLDGFYDDAIKIQHGCTKLDQGLLFWSFKALLNNMTKALRLGWDGLVERTLVLDD